jgi:hypothetical protein
VEIAERIERYRAIEAVRGRPLVVYATSTRVNVPAMMAGDAVRELIDQIDALGNAREVDILLHSTGGDPLAAWKLMSILRERLESVGVLVPYMAFSAATLFALGADEIVMHPHASLGPIDPQITIKLPDGSQRRFSFEDVGAFLRFLADEVRITEQEYVSAVVEKLFRVVDPVHVGGAKRASELSTDVGERLLQMHMRDPEERSRARSIADGLNKSFFAHGDAVSRSRARALQLKIAPDNPDLEGLLWQAYLGLEAYMDLRTPFNPLEQFMTGPGGASVGPKAPLVLPPNAPAPLVDHLWKQVAQQAINDMSQPAVEVDYSLVNALIESPRLASEFRTSGSLSAVRLVAGEIQLSATDKHSGWRNIPVPVAV